MNLLSETHVRKIYAQGAEAIVRLVHRLADRIDELEARPVREPQPVRATLAKELAKTKQTQKWTPSTATFSIPNGGVHDGEVTPPGLHQ